MNIALLTCSKLPNLTPADQLLIPQLLRYGITATPEIWDDSTVNWSSFDYLIFRNTWDYYEKENSFNTWLEQLENLGIKTLNPLEVIQKNKHKFYLRKLDEMGIPIIPTIFIEKTDLLNIEDLMPPHWEKAVIKPAFSGGSYLTEVFDVLDIQQINEKYHPIAAGKELLLQKFIPQIQTLGETSFIFFNKKFSHCVNKTPVAGDFRVQIQFGGKYTLVHPNPALIEQAQQIVNTFQSPLLYARVDGIILNNELLLMEIECIEPDLYFNLSEGSHQRFVHSILELIK